LDFAALQRVHLASTRIVAQVDTGKLTHPATGKSAEDPFKTDCGIPVQHRFADVLRLIEHH
jgi:hypothetical protein